MLGACPLASYARLMGVEETTPPDVHALQNFEVGNVTEAVMAKAMDETKILHSWWTDSQNYGAHYEQKDWKGKLRDDMWFDKELNVTGTPDMLCNIDNQNVLVDVKTASTKSVPFTIKKIKAGSYWEESLGYKYQLGCYMLLCKRRYEKGLETFMPKYGKLVIIDKNVGAIIAEPTLFLDEALELEIINRINYLNQIFQAGNIDEIPCDCASGWKKYFGVNYCNYGVPESIAPNKQKKMVPHQCCDMEYFKQEINKLKQ